MADSSTGRSLPKASLTFLRDLADHNDKAWFDANRARWERDVQEPVRALVRCLGPVVARDFPYIVCSDAKTGGSITRLHRDTRFSKDKQPFHTHVGLHFWHRDSRKMEAPGFFLRIAADEILVGTGLHEPEAPLLQRVREAIDHDRAGWRKASRYPAFLDQWSGLDGESLKRVPSPWPADHEFADDLRRKDFTAFIHLPARAATSPDFAGQVADHWKASKPLMTFLTRAAGLKTT